MTFASPLHFLIAALAAGYLLSALFGTDILPRVLKLLRLIQRDDLIATHRDAVMALEASRPWLAHVLGCPWCSALRIAGMVVLLSLVAGSPNLSGPSAMWAILLDILAVACGAMLVRATLDRLYV